MQRWANSSCVDDLKSKSSHLNKGDLKSKSSHLNKGDLKSKSSHLNKGDLKSKSFWKWWFENQNHIENKMILKSFSNSF